MLFNHPILKNAKRYRTWLNQKASMISVNMALIDDGSAKTLPKIVQVVRYYNGSDDGLPYDGELGMDVFSYIISSINLLSALPNVLYAGHILSDHKCQLLFYLEDEIQFLETLSQLEYDDILIQQDQNWDTFFDFLLPSKTEDKITLSEEMIDSLVENGLDISIPRIIEHCFHFENKDDIEELFARCNALNLTFDSCKYTEEPLELENGNLVYVVKLQQEVLLDSKNFYSQVELFEDMVVDIPVNYVGWEFFNVEKQRRYLN